MTSKTFAKSMNTTPVNMLLFILVSQWSTILIKAVWHEWFPLNPDCEECSKSYMLMNVEYDVFIYMFFQGFW